MKSDERTSNDPSIVAPLSTVINRPSIVTPYRRLRYYHPSIVTPSWRLRYQSRERGLYSEEGLKDRVPRNSRIFTTFVSTFYYCLIRHKLRTDRRCWPRGSGGWSTWTGVATPGIFMQNNPTLFDTAHIQVRLATDRADT